MNRIPAALLVFLLGAMPSLVACGPAHGPARQPAATAPNASKQVPDDPISTDIFSEADATRILDDLRNGLEAHSRRRFLSAFDERVQGFPAIEEQIQAYFDRYEAFRMHYRISQTSVEGVRGIILVEVNLEQIPSGGGAPPQRRREQLRFELERSRKGWKIVDFSPRAFFS